MTKHLLRKLLVGGGTLVLLCSVLSSCQLNDQSTAMTQAMTSQTTNIERLGQTVEAVIAVFLAQNLCHN